MRIRKLRINGYGKFTDKEISLGSGLNLIYGKNEAGKSTLQSFLKAMLFDFPRKNIDGEGRLPDSKKYKPWSGSDFGGMLEIETDEGSILKIDRDFARKNASIFDNDLRDITSTFTYSKKNGLAVGEDLLSMDRECFENTAFIKQGGTIVLQNDRKNLFEKLMNLSQTGNENTSAASALSALSTAATALGNTRTKNRPYNIAMAEFRNLTAKAEEALKKRMEMSEYHKKKQRLEKEIKQLKAALNTYELSLKASELAKEKDQILRIKNKYDIFSSDIKKLSDDIYDNGRCLEENQLSENITEAGILENIKITATSLEKQKSIDEGDPEARLIKLEKSQKSKRIWLAVCYTGVTVSTLLAFLLHPAIFVLTAVFTAALIYLHFKKPSYSAKNLQEQLNLIRECRQDLVMVNAFIDSAGQNKAPDFNVAEILLSNLFESKKQSAVLQNQLTRQKERKSDIEKFRGEVLGQYSSISEINTYINDLNEKISKAGVDQQKESASTLRNPRPELESKQREFSGVNAVLSEYIQSDEEAAQLEESLEIYREKLASIQTELRAMEIASEFIVQSAEQLQKEIIPRLNEKTGKILEKITDGSHSSLATGLDNEMNTEFQNAVHSLWEFSDGTVDQMYFALRIAASEVFSEKESVPIIIDEAFAYYDENRIKSTFDFLSEIAEEKQIIVFTCKEKEIDIVSGLTDINIIKL